MAKKTKENDNAVAMHRSRIAELEQEQSALKQQVPDSAEGEFQQRRRGENIGKELTAEAAALETAAAQARAELSQPLLREQDELKKRAADRRDRFVQLMIDMARLRKVIIGDCGGPTEVFHPSADISLFITQFKQSLSQDLYEILASSPLITPEVMNELATFRPGSIAERARLGEIDRELKRIGALSVDDLIAVSK